MTIGATPLTGVELVDLLCLMARATVGGISVRIGVIGAGNIGAAFAKGLAFGLNRGYRIGLALLAEDTAGPR